MRIKSLGGCMLAVVLTACSGGLGGSSSSSGSTPKTVDEGAAAFASSICDTFNRCGSAFITILYGTVENCRARETAQVKAQFSAAGTNATGDQLAKCGADIAAQSCTDALYGDSPASCELPGTKANGDSCGISSQCSSQHCKITTGTCGTCASQGAAGASCTVASDCAKGLTCDSGMHCVAVTKLNAGANCDTSSVTARCSFGTYCHTTTGTTGTCQNPLGANASCMTGARCDTGAGLVCDSTSMMCKPIAYADANQPCGSVNGVATVCRGNGLCTGTGTNRTCQAPVADGASCNETNGPNCQYPADCNSNNVCVLVNTCG